MEVLYLILILMGHFLSSEALLWGWIFVACSYCSQRRIGPFFIAVQWKQFYVYAQNACRTTKENLQNLGVGVVAIDVMECTRSMSTMK